MHLFIIPQWKKRPTTTSRLNLVTQKNWFIFFLIEQLVSRKQQADASLWEWKVSAGMYNVWKEGEGGGGGEKGREVGDGN